MLICSSGAKTHTLRMYMRSRSIKNIGEFVEKNVEELVRVKSSGRQVVPISEHDEQGEDQGQAKASAELNIIQEANPQDAWLPITESRKGNFWTSAFLLLCSGIGFQALALPVAFVSFGWYWGIIWLSIAFVWQLYTICLLVNLHETVPPGIRYSRFLHLSITAFGVKLGKLLVLFPVMYLSGGTCVLLIINGGGTLKLFYQVMCGNNCTTKPLTGAEWYLVFVLLAIFVAQFCPNMNSVARVSIIGAITAVGYCNLLWILSLVNDRPEGISHGPKAAPPEKTGVFGTLNALGLIAITFRGHNVVLEIQGTMPSTQKLGSKEPMQIGVAISYLLIASCFFPLALAGYWAYGNKFASAGGILSSFMNFHGVSTPKLVKAIIYLMVVINYIAVFQIYAMVVFDNLERIYVTKNNKKCPRWFRSGLRILFGGFAYFVAVALPFLGSLSALIGGFTALPLTFAYPCFMWIAIKNPPRSSAVWCVNLAVGCLGIVLSLLVVVAAVRTLVVGGIDANFFKP